MLTSEEVTLAYRYILGRDPESADVLAEWMRPTRDREELRNALLNSAEFAALRAGPQPTPQPAKAAKWAAVEVFGGQRLLWLDLADDAVSRGCLNDDFEPTETSFVRALVGEGDVFLDIGANVGWFTMLASTLVGKRGQVLAFEPRQSVVAHLKRSVAMNGLDETVVVHGYALGQRDCDAKLAWEEGANDPGRSYLTPTPEDGAPGEMVEVRRLDALALRRIDFVKIDVAGAERRAFEGALATIKRCRPVVMSTVDERMLLRVSGCGAEDYVAGFAQLGYACFSLDAHDFGRPVVGSPADRVTVALIPNEKLELVRARLTDSGIKLDARFFVRSDGDGRSGLTRDQVREAFVLLLRREPRREADYRAHENLPDFVALRRVITASAEFRSLDEARRAAATNDALVQIHIEKTGGTSVHRALAAQFEPGAATAEGITYSEALAIADEDPKVVFFSGHFNYETAASLPRGRKRMVTVLREPRSRLISFYRFQRSHSLPQGELTDSLIYLAQRLDPVTYFRHPAVRSAPRINNCYLSCFAATLADPLAHLREGAPKTNERLQLALLRVRGLDGVGIMERMGDSIKTIFADLGFAAPTEIPNANRTDDNAKIGPQFSAVAPIELDAELEEAMRDLVAHDDVIYAAARDELSRRMAERSQQ